LRGERGLGNRVGEQGGGEGGKERKVVEKTTCFWLGKRFGESEESGMEGERDRGGRGDWVDQLWNLIVVEFNT